MMEATYSSPAPQRGDLVPAPLYTRADVAEKVRAKLHELWRVEEKPLRNPCAQPVSLERKHLPLLNDGHYVVAEKSDGVRYTLFLTRAEGAEVAFLIDRKLSMYQVPVAARKGFFDGSIFDGELVWVTNPDGTTSQNYLVFDMVASCKKRVSSLAFFQKPYPETRFLHDATTSINTTIKH